MRHIKQTAARWSDGSPSAAMAEHPAPLHIADGTLEAIKWLCLVLMTADHVNKFLFDERLPFIYEAARVVMPLFGFVLAYNMARPHGGVPGRYARTVRRLALYGSLATPAFVAMVGWWPLNVMFMLLMAIVCMELLESGKALQGFAAAALFLLGGAFVEFWWFGVATCVASWAYCKRPTAVRALVWLLTTALLGLANGNLWALAAAPIVAVSSHVNLRVPRLRVIFYVYYPAHLCALYVVARWLQ